MQTSYLVTKSRQTATIASGLLWRQFTCRAPCHTSFARLPTHATHARNLAAHARSRGKNAALMWNSDSGAAAVAAIAAGTAAFVKSSAAASEVAVKSADATVTAAAATAAAMIKVLHIENRCKCAARDFDRGGAHLLRHCGMRVNKSNREGAASPYRILFFASFCGKRVQNFQILL